MWGRFSGPSGVCGGAQRRARSVGTSERDEITGDLMAQIVDAIGRRDTITDASRGVTDEILNELLLARTHRANPRVVKGKMSVYQVNTPATAKRLRRPPPTHPADVSNSTGASRGELVGQEHRSSRTRSPAGGHRGCQHTSRGSAAPPSGAPVGRERRSRVARCRCRDVSGGGRSTCRQRFRGATVRLGRSLSGVRRCRAG